MTSFIRTVEEFKTLQRIVVVGVSRTKKDAANLIYLKLRDSGYQVFAVNPNADIVEGDQCYPDLSSIPTNVEGVVLVTRPEISRQYADECVNLNIPYVWMHKSFMASSISEEAINICKRNKIKAIAGGCPMMFYEPVDFGHKCMRWILKISGGFPNTF